MTTYSRADHRAQWFADTFPGSLIRPNVVVWHTTETLDWPGYDGGASAPHVTVHPFPADRRLAFRQHFPFEASSRALRNLDGGVETNTLNAIQVELIGTCDLAFKRAHPSAILWPDAPDWALEALAHFVRELAETFPAIPLRDAAPRGWLPYPSSFGNERGQRMSFSEWRAAVGHCGHQHVPENTHGDPGNFPIRRLLTFATPPPPAPKPTVVQTIRKRLEEIRDRARRNGNHRRARRFQCVIDLLPKR